MSFVTRCDRCETERKEGQIAGWSKVSVYKRANRPDLHLDLCPVCTNDALSRIGMAQPAVEVEP